MNTSDRAREGREEQQTSEHERDQVTERQGKHEDRSRYDLVRESVEDLANEPMREEGEDEGIGNRE